VNKKSGHILPVWLVCIVLCLTIGGLLFEYSFEFWATYFKGQPVDIPFTLAMFGGLLLNGFNIPIAIITAIFSCVL
jgi:hypothetical protein